VPLLKNPVESVAAIAGGKIMGSGPSRRRCAVAYRGPAETDCRFRGPRPGLLKMLPESLVVNEPVFQRAKQLQSSPIISIHLWFDQSITRRAFVGLLDTQIQCSSINRRFFRRRDLKGYVSVVISGAHAFIDWKDNEILAMAIEELRRLMPGSGPRSCFVPGDQRTPRHAVSGVGSDALRPDYRSPVDRLLLAGDWMRTGLPATIESACVSGHACAKIISSDPWRLPTPPEVVHAV